VHLHEQGVFTWTEWAEALSAEIRSDDQVAYYQHWLTALEKIVASKQLATRDDLLCRKQQWHDVAENTPHGNPIVLGKLQ